MKVRGSEPGWEVSQLTSTTRPFGPASIVMPRQRSNATDQKDARVRADLDAYLEKKYKSITKAVKAFNAPVSTVKHRVRGRQRQPNRFVTICDYLRTRRKQGK